MFLIKLNLNQKTKKLVKTFDNSTKKKIFKQAKIIIQPGSAKAAPPISSVLGQFGINLLEFCERFNTRTKHFHSDLSLMVLVIVFNNKTFSFFIKTVLISEIIYSFCINDLLAAHLHDINDKKKKNNLIINFYKAYIMFLFAREQSMGQISNKVGYSFNSLNFLNQIFGYINSFNKFKGLVK